MRSPLLPSTPAPLLPRSSAQTDGEAIFQQQCSTCHTIGGGKLVGPDLKGATARRDRDWLVRWISAPDRMLAAGDSMAVQLFEEFNQVPMPNLGLTDAQVAALIAYLEMQAGGGALREAPLPQPAQPQPVQGSPPLRIGGGAGGGGLELPPGDPMIGKELFNGMLRFQNGGPPCMACHSVTGIGALGGGALGPDLTPAVEKYGGAKGLDAFLGGVPTATMNAIWSQKPLTPEERANILAFLQQAAVQRRPSRAVWTLTGLAVGGLVVLLVLAQLVWHRRLIEVRRPMLRQTA